MKMKRAQLRGARFEPAPPPIHTHIQTIKTAAHPIYSMFQKQHNLSCFLKTLKRANPTFSLTYLSLF